jgi:hypothetical protein
VSSVLFADPILTKIGIVTTHKTIIAPRALHAPLRVHILDPHNDSSSKAALLQVVMTIDGVIQPGVDAAIIRNKFSIRCPVASVLRDIPKCKEVVQTNHQLMDS